MLQNIELIANLHLELLTQWIIEGRAVNGVDTIRTIQELKEATFTIEHLNTMGTYLLANYPYNKGAWAEHVLVRASTEHKMQCTSIAKN